MYPRKNRMSRKGLGLQQQKRPGHASADGSMAPHSDALETMPPEAECDFQKWLVS
jgi:hypothetical protein